MYSQIFADRPTYRQTNRQTWTDAYIYMKTQTDIYIRTD